MTKPNYVNHWIVIYPVNIIIHSLNNLAQGDILWSTVTHIHPLGVEEGVKFTNTPPLVEYH